MAIYKVVGGKEKLVSIDKTSFGQQGVLERHDLQPILRDQPYVLEEGLFIVTEEFGEWEDSNRRIDLLGLDRSGRLVVIELKRGETGEHMDLQAIRYAAMFANITLQQTIDTHQAYLNKLKIDEDAGERIQQHLDETEAGEIYTEKPRIVLVSGGFSTELTTSVLWLNDNGLDINCIRLQPYKNGEEILVEASQVIPLPEAKDYLVKVKQRKQETTTQGSGQVQYGPGGDAFEKSIGQAKERFQPGLRRLYGRLYDCAIDLEGESLVELSTFTNRKGDFIRLNLLVPNKGQNLVSFNNTLGGDGRGGEITFWPDWENIARNSLLQIDQLIGPVKSPTGIRHRKLSTLPNLDTVLTVIYDAYREANSVAVGGDGAGG